MRKYSVFLSSILVSSLFLVCSERKDSTYNFGVAVPFSGQEGAATYGENIKRAVDLAVEEINSKGGIRGKKLEPRYEDTQLISNVAIAAVTKLITVDKVSVIIGDVPSSSTMACAKVVDRYKVILVSPASTSHELSGISSYFFRTIAPDNFEGQAMANYVIDHGFRKFGVAFVDNAGTRGPALVFRNVIESKGGEIRAFEVVAQGNTDVRSQMTKLVLTKPEAVYLLGYALELGSMIKQFREQNQNIPIYSFQVMEEPKVREIAGAASEGVVFTSPTILEADAKGKEIEFIASFKKKYSVLPGIFAANAYDAVYILAATIEKVGTAVEDLRKGFANVRSYEGASGTFDIDEKGDSNQPPQFMTVKSGQLVRLQQGTRQ